VVTLLVPTQAPLATDSPKKSTSTTPTISWSSRALSSSKKTCWKWGSLDRTIRWVFPRFSCSHSLRVNQRCLHQVKRHQMDNQIEKRSHKCLIRCWTGWARRSRTLHQTSTTPRLPNSYRVERKCNKWRLRYERVTRSSSSNWLSYYGMMSQTILVVRAKGERYEILKTCQRLTLFELASL